MESGNAEFERLPLDNYSSSVIGVGSGLIKRAGISSNGSGELEDIRVDSYAVEQIKASMELLDEISKKPSGIEDIIKRFGKLSNRCDEYSGINLDNYEQKTVFVDFKDKNLIGGIAPRKLFVFKSRENGGWMMINGKVFAVDASLFEAMRKVHKDDMTLRIPIVYQSGKGPIYKGDMVFIHNIKNRANTGSVKSEEELVPAGV